MSSLAHVSVATRVVVGIVGTALLIMWAMVPADCGSHHDLHYKLVALGMLLLASVPLVLRVARRGNGPIVGPPHWDIATVAAMAALLLFMQCGPGRRVVPDMCWDPSQTGAMH